MRNENNGMSNKANSFNHPLYVQDVNSHVRALEMAKCFELYTTHTAICSKLCKLLKHILCYAQLRSVLDPDPWMETDKNPDPKPKTNTFYMHKSGSRSGILLDQKAVPYLFPGSETSDENNWIPIDIPVYTSS